MEELETFQGPIVDPPLLVKRDEEVVGRIEQADLRVGVNGGSGPKVGIPQRKISFLDPAQRVTLPNVVLVEKVSAEDLADIGVGSKELPIENEREQ
jgi:hypothetical protein